MWACQAPGLLTNAQGPSRSLRQRADPWSLAFVIAGLPLTVAGCTSLGARLRDAIRPTRPDMFVFAE